MTGRSFSFTYTDHTGAGGSVSVVGGGCSSQLFVAGGDVTVVEAQGGSTVVASIRTTPKARLVSSTLGTGTAVVKAPAGGTETVVTYTNVIPGAELKVCKQAASNSTQLIGEPFSFQINGGTAFSVNAGAFGSANCSGLVNYAAGTHITVRELQPAANVSVSEIDVTQPPATNVSTNLSTRTVTLTVGSGINIVTYTNQINVSSQKGWLEVCKYTTDDYVDGNTFSFTVTDAAGINYGPFTILAGQCHGAIQVTAGPATITEAAQKPFFLDTVEVFPSANYISENTTNGTATVNVAAGDQSTETLAEFFNDTELGYLKVCKALDSANSDALAGDTFDFNWTATLSTGGTASGSVSVVAGTFENGSACQWINDGFGLPLGSTVTISEQSTPNVVDLSGTQTVTVPGTWSADGTPGNNIGEVTFTNQAEGTVEICKDYADPQTQGKPFKFTVNGGAPITVDAGGCSGNITVPAGTATIDELSSTNFHLVSVTATGPDGSNRLLSGSNPITVSVPFGGVGNETLVTYTNAVNTGEFKVCKTSSATADGSGLLLAGDTFYYDYSYTVDNTTVLGKTSVTIPTNAVPGQVTCSGLIGLPGIPVVQSNGNPVTVTVTEEAFPGVHIESITYGGNGALTDSSTTTGESDFTLGIGINEVTYDNEPNPPGNVGTLGVS